MDTSFRVAVVGVGGIGAAACYWASRRAGAGVLGLEQFPLFHDRGASQDSSRILRRAQYQEPYATLAHTAYDTWDEVSAEAGEQLVIPTGGVVIEATAQRAGLATGGRDVDGYAAMMRVHGVEHEVWDAAELQRRYPQFHLDGDERAVFQRDTSLVDAALANAAHVRLAREHGAVIRDGCPVRALRPGPAGVEVVTDDETYRVDAVVMASGAWTNEVLPGAAWPLTVTQEQVTYYSPAVPADFAVGAFPIFMWHGRENFYGFPVHGGGTKLGQHLGGHETTARERTFVPDDVRIKRQRLFLDEHVPGFAGPEIRTKTCLYTLPPDQHFVLGPLVGEPRIVAAVGAGHAYKFASLLGRILSEQAIDGHTAHPVEAFRTDRPALVDPSFERAFHV
jgi:sarcosine oxidase